MYEDLVKLARHCAEVDACINCPVGGCQGVTGIMNRLADAIEELSRAQEQWIEQERKALLKSLPRWIPVTEGLPKAYEDVLLLFPHNQAAGFVDRDGCWSVYSGDGFYTEVADNEPKPTHWASKLPEPPKENGKSET